MSEMTVDRARMGGEACRDGFAADYERRTGQSWYAHITKGGTRRPRSSEMRKAGQPRGGSRARFATKEARIEQVPTRFT